MKRRDFCAATLASTTAVLLARRSFGASPPADIPAIGRTGAQRVLRGRDVADLRAAMRGALLLAVDDGYEQARHLWNGSFDRANWTANPRRSGWPHRPAGSPTPAPRA